MKQIQIPKMRDAVSTKSARSLVHIKPVLVPSQSESGEYRMNWHCCDKMSSVGDMGAGGGS